MCCIFDRRAWHSGSLAAACWDLVPLTRDGTQAPCVGIMKSWTLDHQGSPLIFFVFLKAGWGWCLLPALEFATPILVQLPKRPSLCVSIESSPYWPTKRIMFPNLIPAFHFYQVPLTSGVLHQLMPFSCPLITPFWRWWERSLELTLPPVEWVIFTEMNAPEIRDWLFISISIVLTPGRAKHGRCLLRILLTLKEWNWSQDGLWENVGNS